MKAATINLLDAWAKWPDRKIYNHYCYLINRPIESWQLDDWHFVDQHRECCILRSRKASKTTDLVDWLICRLIRHPEEKWAWLAVKSGQLVEANLAIRRNPFFQRQMYIEKKKYMVLKNGASFVFGSLTNSNLGLNLHGIIIDEEQDMEPNQRDIIYPQVRPMLAVHPDAKIIHSGTRWINTILDENVETYPTSIRDYTWAPWLTKKGSDGKSYVDREIEKRPSWEIDLLYRAIRAVPHGLVLTNVENLHPLPILSPNCAGIDINQNEAVIEAYIEGNVCYILREWEGDYINRPQDFDHLRHLDVEVEDGGYNSKEAQLMVNKLGCSKHLWDNETKSARMTLARSIHIIYDKLVTPNVARDIEGTPYDPRTGLYFKHPQKNPCHWLDALFHCIHPPQKIYKVSPTPKPRVGEDTVRMRARLMGVRK